MDQPALVFNGITLYWHGIFMTAAIVLGIAAALLLSAAFQRQKALAVFDAALPAVPFGLLGARALYCASSYGEFSGPAEMLRFADGGYALYGAILGAFLAAAVSRARHRDVSLGAVCDCLAGGGALGIAAGRLAGYFSYDNVDTVVTSEKFHVFPLFVYNEKTGFWALATFNLEALAELVIFIVLCLLFARANNEKKGLRGADGDIALLFLLLHGASEVVFDSMQADALKFPGNSFVRIQQIIGALSLAAVMTVWVIRSVRRDKFRLYHLLSLAAFWGMIAVAAYLEFDRISDTNYFLYHGVMLIAMLCASAIGIAMYSTTLTIDKK